MKLKRLAQSGIWVPLWFGFADLARSPSGHLLKDSAGDLTTACCGACCDSSGNCTQKTECDCTSAGGTYKGHGTSCAPNPCGPTGACCNCATASCAVMTKVDCLASGGAYMGDNSTCDDECTSCSGACAILGEIPPTVLCTLGAAACSCYTADADTSAGYANMSSSAILSQVAECGWANLNSGTIDLTSCGAAGCAPPCYTSPNPISWQVALFVVSPTSYFVAQVNAGAIALFCGAVALSPCAPCLPVTIPNMLTCGTQFVPPSEVSSVCGGVNPISVGAGGGSLTVEPG